MMRNGSKIAAQKKPELSSSHLHTKSIPAHRALHTKNTHPLFQNHLRLVSDTSGYLPIATYPVSRFALLYL